MQTLIFLNGNIPKIKIIKEHLKKASFIVAADGGANHLRKIRVIPDLIIGDLDSVSKGSLKYFTKHNTLIKKVTDQNKTDFEKSLIYCLNSGKKSITVFGAVSLRADHTLNNYSVLKRYYKKLEIKLITDDFEIFFVKGNFESAYKKGEIVSLLAMPKASGIRTTGLEYSLKDESLEFGKREGALNRSVSDKIKISFKTGSLLLFKKHFNQ